MARKHRPGLRKRGKIWHIEKLVKGYGTLSESTGETEYASAEQYMDWRINEIRRTAVFGDTPKVTFREAAKRYVEENGHLATLERAEIALKHLMPFIGDMHLQLIDNEALAPYRQARVAKGIRCGTINKELSYVRRILNLAARVWRTNAVPWLATPPLLGMAKGVKKKPYPLTWAEQDALFEALPAHLQDMALFAVNTGLREHVVCSLRWHWEVEVPELGTSVFLMPGEASDKNDLDEYIIVLNRIARRVLEARRGMHRDYVFTYRGRPVCRMNNNGWRKAWKQAGLTQDPLYRKGPHNLRHTFGHRLRAVGVSLEDRQALLWHKSATMTTHYSAPDIARLVEAAEKICDPQAVHVLRISRHQAGRQKAVLGQEAHNLLNVKESARSSAG